MRLAYFVHDLQDAAVARRIRMLRAGGIRDIALLGFRRTAEPPALVEGIAPVDLGRTADGRFWQRGLAVARAAAGIGAVRAAVGGAQLLLARQLETLALASLARRRFAPEAGLAYECLDVHRLMVSPDLPGRALRTLEGRLLQGCGLLLTSSPAFLDAHFRPAHALLPPVRLVENKVLEVELPPAAAAAGDAPVPSLPPGPPWRIGWFGIIRCARSLELLASLVRRLPGQVEVVIRGRPSRDAVPDFDAIVAATPGLSFLGPYDRAVELRRIYADVHLTWAMDFFEAGANSDWLLPNRLYEGGLHQSVPLAHAGVETGRWLAARGAGLLLAEPLEESLPALLAGLTPEAYARARAASARLPRGDLVADGRECAALAAALAALAPAGQQTGAGVMRDFHVDSAST
jgi:succinoglycan biosynthesis protein ExoL